MTKLEKLTVSLTKHGAHKAAALLKKYSAEDVLNRLSGSEAGINIDDAQAKKNLSVDSKDNLPPLWEAAKTLGNEAVDALMLVAIIFSHHELISAMTKAANKRAFAGTIRRDEHIEGKAFTNFANNIEELGYSTGHSPDHVDFNLHRLFQIRGLNTLVRELLALKLKAAGWSHRNTLEEEVIRLGFNEVFSLSTESFVTWLTDGAVVEDRRPDDSLEDVGFFTDAEEAATPSPFVFKPGHTDKKTGTVAVTPSGRESKATLLHNEIQNALYARLRKKHGEDNVATEHDTGQGTSIDIAVKTGGSCCFYEIKTAKSVKACIRQAIPQLLEYAYWHGKDDRADRLVIVSQHAITREAEIYLAFLREKFCLPIYYEQYITD